MNNYIPKKLVGKVYPSTNEFTIGLSGVHPCSEQRKSREYERIHAMQYHDLLEEDGTAWMRLDLDTAQVYCPAEVEGQEARLNMGLSGLRNCRNRPERYGSKGMTSYGSRMVKSGAAILEEKYGKERLVFGTYTLPDLEPDFHEYIHQNWGEFVKRIFEHITRELKRKDADCTDYVAVSEIQEKRYRRTGHVYLHLHFVIVNRKNEGGYYIGWRRSDRILEMVIDSLRLRWQKETGKTGGIRSSSTKAGGRLERIEKSVVGYLGKYMSKGRSTIAACHDDERVRCFPRQWWSMSVGLRDRVKEGIRCLSSEFCIEMASNESFRKAHCKWVKLITKEFNGKTYLIGLVGQMHFVEECMLAGFEPEVPKKDSRESVASLDSSARIRIKRRRIPLENACPWSSRRRSESVEADRVKSERLSVEDISAYMQLDLPY